MFMHCIAIDDEPLALNLIRDFCAKVDFIQLEASFTSAIEAIGHLAKNQVDLIFLDIQMPHLTGIEFVSTLQKPPMIIFTTAYSSYALEGFNLNAVDYLVKPFAFDRFLKAAIKANQLFNLSGRPQYHVTDIPQISGPERFLMVKVEYSNVKIDIRDILFIEGLKDYIKIYTGPKPILTKSTLKNILDRLPADDFVRVHKSFIVALAAIQSIENNRIHIGDKLIPVGSQYKAEFQEVLKKIQL